MLLLLKLFVFAVVDYKADLFSRFVPIRIHDQNNLEKDNICKLVLLFSIKPKCLARTHSFTFPSLVVNKVVVGNSAVANS